VAQFVGLGASDLLARPLVRMPGRVALPTAIRLHLTGDRGGCAAEPPGDRAQRLVPADPKQDLLTLADRETTLPWQPAERLAVAVLAAPDHEPDHRGRAADLSCDVDQTPALRPQPKRQLLLLRAQVPVVSLHQRPPVTLFCPFHRNRCADGPEAPDPIVLSTRQVRAHKRAIERAWATRSSPEAAEGDRAKAAARLEDAMRTALGRSTLNARSNIGVGYFNAFLKAQEQWVRLRGLDAPTRHELSGPGGSSVGVSIELADHPAEHFEPREEARRLRQMAADREAEADAQEEPQ
jgi:hypothetical protein